MKTLAAQAPAMVCQELPGAERLPTLLRTFDALAPAEGFELQSNHPQKAALDHLTKERPALFEWSPLEEGPDLWRTRVTRRPRGGIRREVAEALEWDHDRLDDLERDAFAARAAGDLALATRLFCDFAHGLRRHIAFEENLLFQRTQEPWHGQHDVTMRDRLEHLFAQPFRPEDLSLLLTRRAERSATTRVRYQVAQPTRPTPSTCETALPDLRGATRLRPQFIKARADTNTP